MSVSVHVCSCLFMCAIFVSSHLCVWVWEERESVFVCVCECLYLCMCESMCVIFVSSFSQGCFGSLSELVNVISYQTELT